MFVALNLTYFASFIFARDNGTLYELCNFSYGNIYQATYNLLRFFQCVILTMSLEVIYHIIAVAHSYINTFVCRPVCLSVSLTVRLSQPKRTCLSPITTILNQFIRNTYHLWQPYFQGHLSNFKVTQPNNLVKRPNMWS